jgi:DNA processing protein
MTRSMPQWAFAAAMAALPLQTPRRLRRLLALGEPSEVWDVIGRGGATPSGIDDATWNAWCTSSPSVADMHDTCVDCGIGVTTSHDDAYPSVLRRDPRAPAVLFHRGDIRALSHRRVGIIGTRRATQAGRFFARTLAAQLAGQSVAVVSGLARGIDVESHVGALSRRSTGGAAPVAVVASGLDVVYPPEHREIWDEMCRVGLVLSESPPGTAPEPHRFPMRNRILAALSEVLVVVESRATGGSMITVREAMARDVTVMAVPGSPNLPTCEGTNGLLRDGCAPVTDVSDVMVALGLDTRRASQWHDARDAPTEDEAVVLRTFDKEPKSMDEVALMASMSVVETALRLGRLEAKGWVVHTNGWWEALIH